MSKQNNKLELPHWSKLDGSEKFLFIFVFDIVLTLVFSQMIYYNLLPNVHVTLGIGLVLASIPTIFLVRKLMK